MPNQPIKNELKKLIRNAEWNIDYHQNCIDREKIQCIAYKTQLSILEEEHV